MKQSILKTSPEVFFSAIKKKKWAMMLAAAAMLGLNLLFMLLRTEENHGAMLILNIAVDILGGSFLIFCSGVYLMPEVRLWRLFSRSREELQGVVQEADNRSQWHCA